jgi:signal transduction histidine kinase
MSDRKRGASLAKFALSRMSFRWQVSLLGTLVVILFFAVLFAIVATLRYTKSAVASAEEKRLTAAATNLAQEYEDRADTTLRNKQPTPLDSPSTVTSQEVMSLVSRIVLQSQEGVGGGFYSSSADKLVGNFYPNGETSLQNAENKNIPASEQQAVIEVARTAASTRQSASKDLAENAGVLLVSAVPIREGYSVVGSAWAVKRLTNLPGANRFHTYLIASGLGAAALASVLLTLLVIQNLQGGVRKIENGLHELEGNLSSRIDTSNEPEEIQHIVEAINRLGKTLKEKLQYEKQMEGQLRHAERLASLGRLVAGVAHEVRNPLATIRLRVQMCRRDAVEPKVKESCLIALEEIERLNGIVNRLLNFARPIQLELEPVDLRALVRERVHSFEDFALSRHVQLMTNLPNKNLLTMIDKDRMAQVFDNIIQNALEAMADGGGTLSVTVASNNNSEKASAVCVEFQDTGKGLSSVDIGHVFDPFFTTKPSGTGLGLSISHELVRAHGGDIKIESEEGRGTSVRVTIPNSFTP